MMGPSHSRSAVAAWFVTAGALTLAPAYTDVPLPVLDLWEVGYGAVVAGAVSHGWLSPDADGHRWLGKLIPGGHRGPLHMPDLVAVVCAALLWLSWASPARGMTMALTVGWLSHVAGDFFYGRVPFALTGGKRVGFELDTDGWVERWFVRRLLGVAAVVSGVAVVWVGLGMPVDAVDALRAST